MFSIAPDKWLIILFTIVPGFIAYRVYALWCPAAKQDWEKMLVEFVAYSLINLLFWLPWVIPLAMTPSDKINYWEVWAAALLVCLISPSLLATLWYKARSKWLHRWFGLDHPIPRAWDHFIQKHRQYFVLFTLKGGRKMGGYYGPNSYTSAYPHDPEIYVEAVCRVNEDGEFVEWVPGSLGAVVRQSEWELIVFLEIPTGGDDGRDVQDGPAGSGRNAELGTGGPGGSGPNGPPGGEHRPGPEPAATPERGIGNGIAENPAEEPARQVVCG